MINSSFNFGKTNNQQNSIFNKQTNTVFGSNQSIFGQPMNNQGTNQFLLNSSNDTSNSGHFCAANSNNSHPIGGGFGSVSPVQNTFSSNNNQGGMNVGNSNSSYNLGNNSFNSNLNSFISNNQRTTNNSIFGGVNSPNTESIMNTSFNIAPSTNVTQSSGINFGQSNNTIGTNNNTNMFGNFSTNNVGFGIYSDNIIQPSTFERTGFIRGNQNTSFSNSSVSSFGTGTQPMPTTNFGVVGQTTTFGNVQQVTPTTSSTFRSPITQSLFDSQSQSLNNATATKPNLFGAAGQNTSGSPSTTFGSSLAGSNLGNAQKNFLFGNNQQLSPFGSNVNAKGFGGASTRTTFGSNVQPLTIGNPALNVSFSNATQNAKFGNTSQNTTFGNTAQHKIFGNTTQNTAFDNTTQSTKFCNISQNTTFGNIAVPTIVGTQSTLFGNALQTSISSNINQTATIGKPHFGNNSQTIQFGNTIQSSKFGNIFPSETSQSTPVVNVQQTTFGTTSQSATLTVTPQSNPLEVKSQMTTFAQPSLSIPQLTSYSGFGQTTSGTETQATSFGILPSTTSLGISTTNVPQNSFSLSNVQVTQPKKEELNKFSSFPGVTTSIETTFSSVPRLSSISSPTIGLILTTASINSTNSFTTNLSASKQPFSLSITSAPFTINSTNASQPLLSNNSSVFSLRSNINSVSLPTPVSTITTALGGTTSSKPTFTSPLVTSSTSAKKGLGGSPISNLIGSVQSKDYSKKDTEIKHAKDSELPPEMKEGIEAFKKFVFEQKKLREEIIKFHDTLDLMLKVEEENVTLSHSLSEISNCLHKIQAQCVKVKNDVLKEQSNIKIAQANDDFSFGVSGKKHDSSSYFTNKSRDFENRVGIYLREIEEVESLSNSTNSSPMTTKDLIDIITKMDIEFMNLMKKLNAVHERVKASKMEHLRHFKVKYVNNNPFSTIEAKYRNCVESLNRSSVTIQSTKVCNTVKLNECVGSSPFDNACYNSGYSNKSVALVGVQRPALFGVNSNSSLANPNLYSNSSNFDFNKPVNLFSTDVGTNKKRK